jgi:hypothetical protein
LFVRTDSDSTVSSFDTENFDDDNDSINSEQIESGSLCRPTVNRLDTDIHISDGYETVNFGLGLKSEESYSTDPFAINYRKRADWDPATKAQWQREWGFIPDLVEKYESVEHAEFTRPFDQFRVLLQVRLPPQPPRNGELKIYRRSGVCTRSTKSYQPLHQTR